MIIELTGLAITEIANGVRLWHQKAANPEVTPNALLLFKRFKSAYDKRNIKGIADCFSDAFVGDVYGAATKADFLAVTQQVFDYVPFYLSICYTFNVYHMIEDSSTRIAGIVNSEVKTTLAFIPMRKNVDEAQIMVEAKPEGVHGIWRITRLEVQ